jgi:1,4-alpha-glucan branching enzyme
MTRDRGALALVLHSHMPYVEGFGTWPFGEEWLWEAVATVYLPLLEVLERGAPVTLGVTPVLCDQLELLPGPAGERLLRFLREIRAAVHAEDADGLDAGAEGELAAEVRRAADDYVRAERALEARGGDLLGAIRALPGVELWTSAATHALLPLLASGPGMALQLATGIAGHERRFGSFDGGLWLPECAYAPGLERDLAAYGVTAFCVDQTAVHGYGAPEQLEPVATDAGPVAVPIDWSTVELVWSDRSGYPVHPDYRDYHRRTIHDLRPWSNSGAPYRHERALALAREHAADFVARCIARLDAHPGPALLTCALDTELLGHWWYEGPAWLAAVFEEAGSQGLGLVTVSEGLARVEPVERPLELSSWGSEKDLSTWDSPLVAELAFAARRAELRTVAAAQTGAGGVERAARELLALQSSDWAFQVTRELAGDYPRQRAQEHLAALADALSGPAPSAALRGLAPDLDVASLLSP